MDLLINNVFETTKEKHCIFVENYNTMSPINWKTEHLDFDVLIGNVMHVFKKNWFKYTFIIVIL